MGGAGLTRATRSPSSTPTTWPSGSSGITRASSQRTEWPDAPTNSSSIAVRFEQLAGIKVEDIAKRLMDYGFHAPTMSWPVPGTLMIEPTESESKAELDRFCDALIAIRQEIRAIESGQGRSRRQRAEERPAHGRRRLLSDNWPHKLLARAGRLSRRLAAGLQVLAGRRADRQSIWGRNLVCTCPPMEEYK